MAWQPARRRLPLAADPINHAAELRRAFQSRWAITPRIFRAPGRVNLIGEHTDYNEGFVMPVAADRWIVMVGQRATPDDESEGGGTAQEAETQGTATRGTEGHRTRDRGARRRGGRLVRLVSRNFGRQATFDLDNRRKETSGPTWINYPQGVADVLERAGYRLPPMNILVWGNVPLGSGMSSSAAFEVAALGLFTRLIDVEIDAREGILKAQQAENEFVGVQCGIMDQFISRMGQREHALLLDCRS